MTNYLLVGGGTAGHVNPLLALADYISGQESESRVIALGTNEGLERDLVPARGYELKTIERLPFPRRPNLYAVKFPLKFLKAVKEIRRIIRQDSIDVVVGFGGYTSAPAYVAASREKVPFVVHEANALPGLANKLGAKNAAAVGVAFPNAKLANAQFTGMPLRAEVETAITNRNQEVARKHFGLDPKMTTLLVTGGSLGAKKLNEVMSASGPALDAAGIQVLHIVGGKSELSEIKRKGLIRIKYCDRMDLAISAADLAISRAGASTVSEFAAFGLPSVYVPYPVGNGEQKFNVSHLVEAEAALSVADQNFNPDYVRDVVIPLISNTKKLAQMSKANQKLGISDGTRRLFQLVRGVLPSKTSSDN